ncbi:MAG: hypothetical protein JJU02_01550 [Cryomorphaceae bacterium]|nr:hypothetical protein [Cryomorphaceae bacterium]
MVRSATVLVVLVLVWQGCDTQKRALHKDYDINGVEEHIVLKDTITLLVLGYAQAQECNDSTLWFSTCFGLDIKTDEIIKVISKCNTDTTINKGDYVEVIPLMNTEERNYIAITATVFTKEHREYKYSPLYRLQVKTVYGSLIKIE